jgi:hypothetical protein
VDRQSGADVPGALLVRRPVNDVYCGLRGFTRELYERLDQRCTGMEFATEMIIKSSLMRERIAEVPITLHPDGRKSHPPHLKTFRDGWRTLRFFMMCTPRQLYLIPGIIFVLLGLVGYALALPATKIGPPRWARTRCCSRRSRSSAATRRSCSGCSPRPSRWRST